MSTIGSCHICESAVEIKPVGRPRKYCSNSCRTLAQKIPTGDLGKNHGPKLPPGTSYCRVCTTIKPLEAFPRTKNGWTPKPACKQCRIVRNAEKSAVRRAALRLELGLPPADDDRTLSRHTKPIGSTYSHRGYVKEKVGRDSCAHPRADKHGWVYQHILVTERKYGFPITEEFTVHHRNRNPSDNRPENLELRVGKHGVGGDVADTLLANEELRAEFIAALERYGYEVISPALKELGAA